MCLPLRAAFSAPPEKQPGFSASGTNYTLHSTEPFQAVHVPFTLRNGLIYLPVTIAGKTQLWLFDTGSTESSWARTPEITGRETGWQKRGHEMFGKGHREFNTILPRVSIGGYERREVPGYAIELTQTETFEREVRGQPRILACSVFAGVVLTLDYTKRELIIRSPDYDPAVANPGPLWSTSFRRLSPIPQHDYGWVVVEAMVAGRPLSLCVDTGFAGFASGIRSSSFGISLAQKKFDLLFPLIKAQNPALTADVISLPVTTQSGPTTEWVQITSPVSFTLGKPGSATLPVKARVLAVKDDYTLVDGLLSGTVLQEYRVTFDFSREKILFETEAIKRLESVQRTR